MVQLLAALAVATPPGVLVDRIVAVVDKQVLTQSELLAEARIALVVREGEQAAAADLDDAALRAFLDYAVNQMLVAIQARRLGAAEIPAAEVEQELRRFAQRFRSPDAYRAFLRRFDIGEDVLRNLIERNLRNDRFLGERMQLIGGGVDASSESPQRETALRRWLDELREAADVRVLGPTGELEVDASRQAGAAPPG